MAPVGVELRQKGGAVRIHRRQAVGMAIAAFALAASGCAATGERAVAVRLHGEVFSDHRIDQPCDEQAAAPSRPEELSGILLVFTDSAGLEMGRATTGELEWRELAPGCRFVATYAVDLPHADRYQVTFDPPEPRVVGGMSFVGAEELHPATVSLVELEATGFEWSFEVAPTYVVP